MFGNNKRVFILALFLGFVFLAAQLHCCVELNSRTADSHICPICSAAGTVVATPALLLAMVPAINRLEIVGETAKESTVVFRNVGPRAPPAS
jgi:hypothetical protein